MGITGCHQLLLALLPLFLLFEPGYSKESQLIIPPIAHTHHFSSICKLSTCCCVVKPYLLSFAARAYLDSAYFRQGTSLFFWIISPFSGCCTQELTNPWELLSFLRMVWPHLPLQLLSFWGHYSWPDVQPLLLKLFTSESLIASKDNKIPWNQCLADEVLLTQLLSLPSWGILCDAH